LSRSASSSTRTCCSSSEWTRSSSSSRASKVAWCWRSRVRDAQNFWDQRIHLRFAIL
jgi:hypothetical protein